MYDIIVIGAGPAGLTAALYASRRALKTLVLSGDIGGQIAKTNEIENYPGLDGITGAELAAKFKHQAERFGAEIVMEAAKKLEQTETGFTVTTLHHSFESKAIILAFGKKPRELEVPGEEKFLGRGVTYCATCDAPFFKNKTVTVVGGGNAALDAAILSSKIASKVYLVHRGPNFRGEQYLVEKVEQSPNIEILFNSEIAEIKGDTVVRSIVLKDNRELETNGVMVEVGYIVDRSLVEGIVDLDEKNQVIVDQHQQTSIPGIFAAGDLTPTPFKQIVISAGEGAKAALAAFDHIQRLQGKRGIAADWH